MAAFHSPESLLDDLGLKAKGDIFALKAFCKRRLGKTRDESSQKDEIEEKKRRLVEQLREEKANKKKRRSSSHKSTKDSEEESPSKKKKKKTKSLVVFKLAGYITTTKTPAMWQCARLKAVAPDALTSTHQRTNSKLLLVPNSFFSLGANLAMDLQARCSLT